MKVIPIATQEEREHQAARIAYIRNPNLPNFERFRQTYEAMQGVTCSTTKK